MPRSVAILVVVAGLASPRVASAQAEQVPLSWNAPSGCPTTAAVLTDVRRNMADSGEKRGPFVASVNVTGPTDGVWQASLRVETRGGRAERRFQGETCESVASAAALIIALAAEGGGDAAAPEPRAAPTVVANPPAGTFGDGRQLSLTMNVLVDGGTMPEIPGGGIEVAAGPNWTGSSWRLRVLAGPGFFPSQSGQGPGSSANFWMLTFSGRGCLTALITEAEIGFCLGTELAIMDIEGPEDFANDTQLWLSGLGSVVASWNIWPKVAVFGRGDLVVPTTRRTFLTESGIEFYEVGAAAARGALGIELRFW